MKIPREVVETKVRFGRNANCGGSDRLGRHPRPGFLSAKIFEICVQISAICWIWSADGRRFPQILETRHGRSLVHPDAHNRTPTNGPLASHRRNGAPKWQRHPAALASWLWNECGSNLLRTRRPRSQGWRGSGRQRLGRRHFCLLWRATSRSNPARHVWKPALNRIIAGMAVRFIGPFRQFQ